MIEIFKDRMEVTNPGMPLINVERFLGTPDGRAANMSHRVLFQSEQSIISP